VSDRTQTAIYASFLNLTLPQCGTPSFTCKQNTRQKHIRVISEILLMVAALCGASYDWTQITCVALLLLSQGYTVFVMPVAV